MTEPQIEHRWYVHGVVHWLSGVLFAVLLASLIVIAGPHLPGLSGFLHNIEQRGLDYAMRLRLHLTNPGARDDYVFIDIDANYCVSVLRGSEGPGPISKEREEQIHDTCFWRSPTQPTVVAAALAKALSAGPRLVLVDAPLWDANGQQPSQNEVQQLTKALASQPGVPVVAASPYRPIAGVGTGATDWIGVPTGLPGTLKFAPAWVWGSAADTDSVVRQYPAEVGEKSPPGEVRTLAFQAASEINPGAAACKDAAAGRLQYTLPSLVSPDPAVSTEPAVAVRYRGFYDRYLASGLFADRSETLNSNLAGRMVIIGSSAVNALDRHESPVGPMAGAEIHLNALKSFLNCKQGFVAEQQAWGRAANEAQIIAVTSIPFFIFWMTYFWLSSRAVSGRARMLLPLVGAGGFLLAIPVAMLLAVVVTEVAGGAKQGFALEFFTPIFALSLEGFAEGARWLIDRIEYVVEHAVFRVVGLFERRGERSERDATD
jgi:CHASE2 domain-containing sensor protein